MTINEVTTIAALILGPILAVQVAIFLEKRRSVKNRRVDIFKTLMATRGSFLSMAHVEALNRIDLEFSNDEKYRKIIEAWQEYFDNLGQKVETEEQFTVWATKNEELLANLLYEMGQSLGYKFSKTLIKRNIYSPVGHARVEKENETIRKGLINLFNPESEVAIPMELVSDDTTLQKQAELQELLMKYYKKELAK